MARARLIHVGNGRWAAYQAPEPAGPPPDPDEPGVLLTPGDGWTAPTAQPDPVGDPEAVGYDAKAIARWDVVPYQTFAEDFNVGVVAFHREGIDRVAFSVNDGEWKSVDTMSLNTQTGVVEYWATIDVSAFVAAGACEVRAVVYPNVGVPRVLDSLYLYADPAGTAPQLERYVSTTGNDENDGLTPETAKATPNAAAFSIHQAQGNADGGIIYLMAGSHTISSAEWFNNSSTVNRWMTVTNAPGTTRDQVIVTGNTGSGFNSKLVRFHNVTITGWINSGGPLVDHVWLDGCHLHGTGWTSTGAGAGTSWSYRYMTDTTIADQSNGPEGYVLVRNVRIDRIGGDAFSNSALVINCSVHEFDQAPGAHTDLWQWTSAANNVIMYGVDNTDQIGGINSAGPTFEDSGTDVAVVNCNLSSGTHTVAIYLTKVQTHVLVKDTTITGGFYYTGGVTATNVVYDGCTFSGDPPVADGVTVR